MPAHPTADQPAGEPADEPAGEPADELDDELDDAALLRWRMRSQRLTGPAFAPTPAGLAAAVEWSGAVQAQDHEPTLWSLARRSGGPALAVPAAAFDAGAFVRTHVLRPTWHLVPPDRLFPLLALTGPRLLRSLAPRWRDLGLEVPVLDRATDAARAALAERGPLTRVELGGVFEQAGVSTEGQRLPHLLMYAELHGVTCSGPMRGRSHTYALAAERVPPAAVPASDDSPGDVARQLAATYVRSHAPATERDLAWWAGLPVGAVRAALAAARPQVRSIVVRARRYWVAGDPPDGAFEPGEPGGGPTVHLLPGFDEYLVAYTESRVLADPLGAGARMPRGGVLSPFLAVDGRVVGSWRRRVTRARGTEAVEVTVTCFVPLAPRARAGLDDEAERYAAALGRPLRLVVEE